MGLDTFGRAKEEFLAGLPEDYRFYVTWEISDSVEHRERVFVLVKAIRDGISAHIASDVLLVSGYFRADAVSFPERIDSAL
jgi:hypothetical protein